MSCPIVFSASPPAKFPSSFKLREPMVNQKIIRTREFKANYLVVSPGELVSLGLPFGLDTTIYEILGTPLLKHWVSRFNRIQEYQSRSSRILNKIINILR